MALILPHMVRSSSKLPTSTKGNRWAGCLRMDLPILCTLIPSVSSFFILFFSQCVFFSVAPSFYIHCLMTSLLDSLCSSFQHFLASSSHPCLPIHPLLSHACLLLCFLPTIFSLHSLSLVITLLSLFCCLFSSLRSLL